MINSSSSSPNNHFITKNLESTQRERPKIKGITQELYEGDKWLKRAKGSRSRRWEYNNVVWGKLDSTANSHPDTEDLETEKRDRGIDKSISLEYFNGDVRSDLSEGFMCYLSQLEWEREKKVRRITPEDVLQFYGVKNFKANGGSHFCTSVTRYRFFDLNSAGRTWSDNIIWVKGNCLQRDDEELLDLRFRSVKQSVNSTVERKESLLDEVAEEETEHELVLREFGLSRKKRVESRSKKVVKAQSIWSMTGVDEGKRQTSGEEIKKALPASGTVVSGKVAQGKRRWVEPLGNSREKFIEGRSASTDDLKEAEERARLAILQGK
ncbi:hypothetical protein GIB67_027600 [Kingdonia uniflora]|uniref:Uncharacterized protein n=1 Tax=Kingdonia uniflora TaxID=39325 RepID=A0A7J7NLI1_9MAGN|nr:hypothetical protein GIB67_027600 [Kingdonia uniflora]